VVQLKRPLLIDGKLKKKFYTTQLPLPYVKNDVFNGKKKEIETCITVKIMHLTGMQIKTVFLDLL